MTRQRAVSSTRGGAIAAVTLSTVALTAPPAQAGGVLAYEVGSADVGLASAGYGARAQDASTVFTNPAGMTRLDGTQFLATGQLLWGNTRFSIDDGTAPALGGDDGGRAFGLNGWFVGGGGFLSYSVSPTLKLGVATTGNFGAPLSYDDDWAGRYYVQKTTLLGLSVLPSVAYQVTDQLSLGASLNLMYGIYENQVAINNVAPGYGDGKLKLDDNTWGWGVNLGAMYEFSPDARLGLTWSSQVDLDFEAPSQFSNLAPGLETLLRGRGSLNSKLKVGIKVPQQAMASLFTQVNDDWALLASIGWQQWSKFGQVQLGLDDTLNPTSLTTELDFNDTWHFAAGAQYRLSAPWRLNVGVAYDTGFQDGSEVSPLLPVNAAWRFGVGAERQLNKDASWGISAEYLYGGTLDTQLSGSKPVVIGGRGDLDGSFDNTGTLFLAGYFNWTF